MVMFRGDAGYDARDGSIAGPRHRAVLIGGYWRYLYTDVDVCLSTAGAAMTALSGKGARRRPLWDIPTRVFHWTVVCLLPLAWWSADQQRFEVHQWVGYTLLVLVLSRVLWGIVGSRHSRFADFLVGPAAITRYVQGGGRSQSRA